MKTLLPVLGLSLMLACNAQNNKEFYVSKIREICIDADIIEIETREDYVEVEYLCNGRSFEAGIGPEGEMLFHESEADIPEKIFDRIRKKLDKNYHGWLIDEFSHVQTQDTAFYKVELMTEGVEENAYFSLDGKHFRAMNVVIDESWSLDELAASAHYMKSPYRFLEPDRTYIMPEILKEISGLAVADDSTLYCVQDELGIVFKYEPEKTELSGMIRFADKGDFEDISVRNEMVFVLRSDGTLFYFNRDNFEGRADEVIVPVNCMNIEGLYFDGRDQKFYMACKEPLINDRGRKKAVYSFSPDQLTEPELSFVVDPEEIYSKAAEHYPAISSSRSHFSPSAIAVHPLSGDKYILSASNRMIAVYDETGLREVFPLPAKLYHKPEGLAFTDSGDLYISSEGVKNGYVDGLIYYFRQGKETAAQP